MPNSPKPAPDPVEMAVAAILVDGGAVQLETDLLDKPDTRCGLRVSYRGRDGKRLELDGSVLAWAGRHGVALEELGWTPADILEMQRLERTWVRQAEERQREHGIDYRRTYVWRWELPPMSPAELVTALRTTLGIIDGRPANAIQYVVRRDGPLERRVVRSAAAFGGVSVVLGLYASAYLVLSPGHAPSDQVYRAVLAGILTALFIFFPVRWRLARMRGAGKWGRLPLWFGMLVLPGTAIFAWSVWGF